MPASIPRYLAETAQRLPDKPAIISPLRSITFGELYHEAMATAECLREMGLESGDRVGICMEKTVDQALAILGVLFANAAWSPSCRGSRDRTSATSSRTRGWRR
ncbi:MAG: AMP-binding protein [Candidatus Accumulibacter sp. UW25]|jgi:acyl-CoA synthetase (AMP-forming)/AMP-acid ligase II